jgi:hypothetical protein
MGSLGDRRVVDQRLLDQQSVRAVGDQDEGVRPKVNAEGRRWAKPPCGSAIYWDRPIRPRAQAPLGMPQIWKPSGARSAVSAVSRFRSGGSKPLEMLRDVVEGEAHQAEFRSADGPRKIAATTLLPTC